MAFKENLLKKIRIDQLADQVLASIGPEGSEAKLDKNAMRQLLALSPYVHHRERDLDLYVHETDSAVQNILVLDNELPIYRTTLEDVAMRKSPELGEMVKIRNIIKILKDSDVKISRKAESLRAVQAESIARLDLTFTTADIDDIRREGIASLESGYAEGVNESLQLFAELLGYRPPPKPFKVPHSTIYAAAYRKESGEHVIGPVVIFSLIHNALRLSEEQFGSLDKTRVEQFHAIASAKEGTSIQGAAVFEYLRNLVLRSRANGN